MKRDSAVALGGLVVFVLIVGVATLVALLSINNNKQFLQSCADRGRSGQECMARYEMHKRGVDITP